MSKRRQEQAVEPSGSPLFIRINWGKIFNSTKTSNMPYNDTTVRTPYAIYVVVERETGSTVLKHTVRGCAKNVNLSQFAGFS